MCGAMERMRRERKGVFSVTVGRGKRRRGESRTEWKGHNLDFGGHHTVLA